MAVSGRSINAVRNEYGTAITGSPPHMNTMASRTYWYGPAPGTSATFPNTNISLNSMYQTSPDNEWYNDCACICGK